MSYQTTELNETPKLDPLVEKIARLYSQGSLVTVDKTTRTKPLDAPVRSEWFGVESFRQVGAVSRTIQSRITVIDEGRLKKLEEIRKGTGEALKYLSYSLSDGNRWIPEKAKPILHREMERMKADGLKMLNSAVGNSVAAFVTSRMPELIKNATDLYHEFNPGGYLSKEVEEAIFKDFCARLDRAKTGTFLPRVSFNEINFPPSGGGQDRIGLGPSLHALGGYRRTAPAGRV